MTSSDDRREVFARLRDWLAIPWYERPWSRDAMQSLGDMVGAVPGENIVERIADLIDRPTCRMSDIGDDTEQVYRCSACGEEYCMSDIKPYPWRFCPNCGAVVVEKGEDDV